MWVSPDLPMLYAIGNPILFEIDDIAPYRVILRPNLAKISGGLVNG